MRRAKAVLVAVITIPLAGCVLSGKPKVAAIPAPPQTTTPATPPEPLSIPQTHVDLPAPQPVNPEALATAPPPEPAPRTPAKPAAPSTRQPRTGTGGAAPLPKTPDQPLAPEPEQPVRTPIGEILSADEQESLRKSAHGHQAETRALLAGAKPKTANQSRTLTEIRQFLKQSEDAENAGDMRLADQLAERANILAKELQSGK